ncbi:hypothetical protein E5A73_02485 [Sphingomonas gei]|uniref:Uncharacterized protein n=1 Tax=Sphingomonas gei TaxID=1395960 RepID=A0A4S1XH74_9SPHN|nr:hypothetical protein [Sphingomonas gei]TGX55999.1 hypothetical protein E5A73_02485 [Sphingomonas gei]
MSEPATIYAADGDGAKREGVAGQGSLAECAEIVEGFSPERRASARIEMDALELRFGPQEIDELLRFLRDESAGLSSQEISAIADPDG